MNTTASSDIATVRSAGRRRLLTAAAWSVPVIAATVASPIAAASAAERTIKMAGAVSFAPAGYGAESFAKITPRQSEPFMVLSTQMGDVITAPRVLLAFERDPGVFSRTSASAGLWSAPQFVGRMSLHSPDQYAYVMQYEGPISATDGVTLLLVDDFAFTGSIPMIPEGSGSTSLSQSTSISAFGKSFYDFPWGEW